MNVKKLQLKYLELLEAAKQVNYEFTPYAHGQRVKLELFEEVIEMLGLDFSDLKSL